MRIIYATCSRRRELVHILPTIVPVFKTKQRIQTAVEQYEREERLETRSPRVNYGLLSSTRRWKLERRIYAARTP